ncbi:asparagine synthase (glutamine-hydrolyzing) [Aquibacillus rhizosphaerae]|uniref:asparagine synthase (glutamine-hydrolyzing) n=1 Tax=Aquibacillus rhizosphaerae TaxID=3051431 RepID=A0ABT7LAI4_9BACI|nr:asparagine synthase (glutamine-hydrolyzing) [Aquibacillus sp. LR5S19]MDL4842876.1 asparagine synthase (glutamine-hydrolyzing) [Aquibacillus sp. LR5S19]
MCGITGWIDFKRDLSQEIDNVRKMANAIQHRGPDQHNEWISDHVAFGHQRLIVVDPDGGKQPMECKKNDSNYVLVYNGELYNTEDIRKSLLNKGWIFNSHSDTEVLLKSYIEWGGACVDKLNGIFAFSIWDAKNEQLFLARDRLGVKPLFYTEKDGGLLFASELKGLIAHDEIEPILDQEGLSEILALGPSRTPGHGVFKGVNELRAGHIGIFDKNGFRTKRYWNVTSTAHTDDVEETADTIRYLLTDAVERQLISDVPLGTFLSGGVDSSAITAIASNYLKRHKKDQLKTFSIDYEDNDKYFEKSDFQPNSDQDFIGTVVEAHNTEHHNFVIDNKKLADMLKEAVELRDLPGMADVDSSLLWFCRQTKEEVTVALSGECADEIFGGYPWFYREEDLKREGFPWIRSADVRKSLLNDEWQKKLNLRDYMLKRYQETIDETPEFEGDSEMERHRRKMFYLNMHWFMPTLLDRKDRMSMGASFEARVPFSDHRLVEYVWNVPWEMKTYKGREKGILRKALEGLLPDEILYRKKSPYPKTHNPEYKNAVIEWVNEILDDPRARLFEIFDKDAVRKLVETEGKEIEAPWFGQLMTGPQLLAHLGQIDHWLRKYDIIIEH